MNPASYIAWPGEDADRDRLGGKAAALAALSKADLHVPDWFVLTPRAFVDSLPDPTAWHAGARPDDDTLLDLAPAPAVQTALAQALDRLCRQAPEEEFRLAVRSSAVEEDATGHSFAGQFESVLGADPGDIAGRVAEVWRSTFAESVRAYRRVKGLSEQPSAPAVLVQRMVHADRAGVAFSADPSGGARGTSVVSAVRGLGPVLVDGAETGDTYRVNRTGTVMHRDVTRQHAACRLTPGGVRTDLLPEEEGGAPALTDAEVQRVAALALRIEDHFGVPQDIEWALEGDRLYLLQARPITTLEDAASSNASRKSAHPPSASDGTHDGPRLSRLPSAQAEGARILWDNSNIAESYSGVTTPLTFSFARRAYGAVYRAFCRALGVPRARVEDHADVFRSMIGLLRGRLYYNLGSWYTVLRLLPGFRFNRAFMEDMMGVDERLPADFLPPPEAAAPAERVRDAWHLARSAARLVQAHRQIETRARVFRQHVDRTLAAAPPESLDDLPLDALVDRYRHLEEKLLDRWDVPILNDFLTMIFFGLSRRLLAAWVPDGEGLHAALLSGMPNVVSAVPARLIDEMAEHAADDEALAEALTEGPRAAAEAALRKRPALRARYETYLERFGDRCLGELKLESPTLREDPLPLLRAVGARLHRRQSQQETPAETPQPSRRTEAEARLAKTLRGRPVRRRLLRWSLRHARLRIATRENLRFERTRVFGTARRLFLEMGRRLAAAGSLDEARDVFYLEVEELLGYAHGTATTTDLAGLASVRREEFARYRACPTPPDRFVTRGAAHARSSFDAPPAPAAPAGGASRTGQGCGAGRARGPVCVVDDPRAATLTGDEILVARQTDPGWTPLFASCAGVVVERGNLLSHAAVVAREMGLPAVVGVEGATTWLRDAERAAVDGRDGTVCVLERAAAASSPPACRPAEVAN